MLRSFPRVLAATARPTVFRAALSTTTLTEPNPLETIKTTMSKYGLDRWYIQFPIGIFLAIPIIERKMLMLSEETMLIGCFAAFCGTSYMLLNDSIAEMMDAKTKTIMAEHNAAEEAAIDEVRKMAASHEKAIALCEAFPVLASAQVEVFEMKKAATLMAAKHEFTNGMVKELDQLVAKEESAKLDILNKLISSAAASVAGTLASNKKAQNDFMAEAISSVSNPNAKSATVEGLMKTYFKSQASAKA